ncbi:archaellin/type IV pilin N-terminal domain-containing protein [Nanoarchaeota archaeon]
MRNKRGISPVIATVLLIAIVVVIALIIFLWFRGIGRETVTKFGGTNIELICEDVYFEADYTDDHLYVSNIGNVPIYSIKVKSSWTGGHEEEDIRDITSEWPEIGLNQGGTYYENLAGVINAAADKIVLIPVLRGITDSGEQKSHVCDEGRYGYGLLIN